MSTGELHECLYAPYAHRALGLQPPDPAVEPILTGKDQPAQVH
jgi:hypothetical protein